MHAYQQGVSRRSETTYPTLPVDMQRGDVERLIRRVGPQIGLSPGRLAVLLAMMDETRPSDWIRPDREPVCFAMQINIARICGQSTRSVRRTEDHLEQLGLIRKEVTSNGQRSRFRSVLGEEARTGIFFTPLIEALPGLLGLREQLAQERFEVQALKQKISAARRMVKRNLETLRSRPHKPLALQELESRIASWPTRFEASAEIQGLQDLLEDIIDVDDQLEQHIHEQTLESGPPDSGVRPLQDTTQDRTVFCNAHVGESTAGKPADTNIDDAPPDGGADCLEKQDETDPAGHKTQNQENLKWLTPDVLCDLCTDEMQLRILLAQGKRPCPAPRDFVIAAIDRLVPLGIHPSAWQEAVDQMGDLAAALCILIIDNNVAHPETPIQSPGGVLRAMTARHQAGQLRLNQSLVAIRKRKGKQVE